MGWGGEAMTTPAACAHCGLPVGRLGLRREVAGEARSFCCYGCCLAAQLDHGEREEPEAAALLIRLGVGAFLAMFIMLFSLLQYAGAFADGADAAVPGRLIDALMGGLATPLLAVVGWPFFAGAGVALRAGRINADALVSLGVLGAYGYSVWQVLRGSGLVYFDTAAMVLLLFTLGRYLEAQGRVRVARSLAPMLAAERALLRVVTDRGEHMRAAVAVLAGDRVRVLAGERIGVDGVVVAGRSACDESVLSGQSEPRPKAPGDRVVAGSLNGRGVLLVRATVAGAHTQWAHAGRLVREALARKSALGEALDRVAALFVPLVLGLAAATTWYWGARAGADAALLAGLSVLVVACPCALGLAAPLAAVRGLGEAARRGILIRGGGVLERLARVRAVAFDKTGTLTRGAPQVLGLATAAAPLRTVWRRARALAAGSDHPFARALRGRRSVAAACDLHEVAGAGVVGTVDGERCALGSAALMAAQGWAVPAALAAAAPPGSRVWIGWGGQVRGVAGVADATLPEAAPAVAALHRAGLPCMLLSGDGAAAVAALAAELGMTQWRAELLPADKVAVLQHWRRAYGPLAMVGDGLNDGPVLAAASVGIAVGGASDLARESADVILPRAGLVQLPALIALARAVQRAVHLNVCWALGYNAVALTLAASGQLRPVWAAALMAGSSLLVVARSLRAQRVRGWGEVDAPRPWPPAPRSGVGR